MSDEAFRVIGVPPGSDARTVEDAYWKRARELAKERAYSGDAGRELEQLNAAYQTVSKDFVYGTRNLKGKPPTRGALVKRFAFTAIVAGAVVGALIAGLGFRAEITDGAKQGYDQGEEGWTDTIEWLQEFGTTPTPAAPGEAKQPPPAP
jgi:hypothetical protein